MISHHVMKIIQNMLKVSVDIAVRCHLSSQQLITCQFVEYVGLENLVNYHKTNQR